MQRYTVNDDPRGPRLDEADDGEVVLYQEVQEELHRLQRWCEVLRQERDQARQRTDSAVRLLIGIHSLLYPAPLKTADGRTMVFRPKDPDPHTVLQELSDRIRALPDEMNGLT